MTRGREQKLPPVEIPPPPDLSKLPKVEIPPMRKPGELPPVEIPPPEPGPTGPEGEKPEILPSEPTPEPSSPEEKKSLRRRLNEATVTARFRESEELKQKLEQVKYAERSGLESNKKVEEYLKGIVEKIAINEKIPQGDLEEFSQTIGVSVKQLNEQVIEPLQALRERLIQQEANNRTKAGWKSTLAMLGGGVALTGVGFMGILSAPWLGAAAGGFAAYRLVDALRRHRKGQQIEKELRSNADFGRKAMDEASYSLTALAKQLEIQGVNLADLKGQIETTIDQLAAELPEDQREKMKNAEKLLLTSDLQSEKLENQQQQKSFIGRLFTKIRENTSFQKIDKLLRGGRNVHERAQTTTLYVVLGTLARTDPRLGAIISPILLGLGGQSLGNLASMGVESLAPRYREVLRSLDAEQVSKDNLDRARAQLDDQEWRKNNPTEAARLREKIDQLEQEAILRADKALEFVSSENQRREENLTVRLGRKREARWINLGLRVGGAALGAFLGPELVDKIREWRTRPEAVGSEAAGGGKPAPVETVTETKPIEVPKEAIVGKGEGVEHALIRQLEGQGLSHQAAQIEAHKIAVAQGYVHPDGTEVRVVAPDKVAYVLTKGADGQTSILEVDAKTGQSLWSPGIDEHEYLYHPKPETELPAAVEIHKTPTNWHWNSQSKTLEGLPEGYTIHPSGQEWWIMDKDNTVVGSLAFDKTGNLVGYETPHYGYPDMVEKVHRFEAAASGGGGGEVKPPEGPPKKTFEKPVIIKKPEVARAVEPESLKTSVFISQIREVNQLGEVEQVTMDVVNSTGNTQRISVNLSHFTSPAQKYEALQALRFFEVTDKGKLQAAISFVERGYLPPLPGRLTYSQLPETLEAKEFAKKLAPFLVTTT